jgi:hypothetical protein
VRELAVFESLQDVVWDVYIDCGHDIALSNSINQ